MTLHLVILNPITVNYRQLDLKTMEFCLNTFTHFKASAVMLSLNLLWVMSISFVFCWWFLFFVFLFIGVGTRNYYRKLGYELEGPYMSKSLV